MSKETKTTSLTQPKFKFGDKVITTRGAIHEFEVDHIFRASNGIFHYKFYDKDGYTYYVKEENLKFYTPPARTYSVTKQLIAEAWDKFIAGPDEINDFERSEASKAFEKFCKHLGMSDE